MNCTGASTINGDIAGTGVRVSFYVQNFLLVLLMKRSRGDTENALWTFVATSFGLIVAALTQLRGGNLSFIDGILVSQLVWFANLGTFLALASYSRSKGKKSVIRIAATLQGYFSMILTILMWTMNEDLPYGRCESIRFVVMFAADMPAPGPGRIVALVFASLALAAFTVMTCIEVRVWARRVTDMPDLAGLSREHGGRRHPGRQNHHRHRHSRREIDAYHSRWGGWPSKLGSFFIGILISQVFIFVYFISTTELIIRRSHADISPSTWSFGQVLAMTVVIPSLVALLSDLMEKGFGDKDTTKNSNHTRSGSIPENGRPEPTHQYSESYLTPPAPGVDVNSISNQELAGPRLP